MTTKPQYEFEKLVKTGIEKLGAKPDDYYQYKLLTKYGLLKISIHGDWVATRFQDPKVNEIKNLKNNKWNHYFNFTDKNFPLDEPNQAAKKLLNQINKMIPNAKLNI